MYDVKDIYSRNKWENGNKLNLVYSEKKKLIKLGFCWERVGEMSHFH